MRIFVNDQDNGEHRNVVAVNKVVNPCSSVFIRGKKPNASDGIGHFLSAS